MKKKTAVIAAALCLAGASLVSCLGVGGWKWYDANVDRSGWIETEGRRAYKNFHGKPVTGWQQIDGSRYFFGDDAAMVTHWLEQDGSQYYLGENGAMVTGWQEIDNNRYYFRSDGTMHTGWLEYAGLRWYMGDDGAMATGWLEADEKNYFLQDNGLPTVGWAELDGKRYCFSADGIRLTGWQELGGKRYHFGSDGVLSIGWLDSDDQRYYLNEDGSMHTGWLQVGEYRYYLQSDGTMAVNPTKIGEQTYYFTPAGIHVVLVNATHPVPEDYTLELVTLDNGFQMDKRCVDALTKMLDDCVTAGCTYKFNSGYRSLYEQKMILEERTDLYMDQGYSFDDARYMALLTVCIPGTSEHHLGLAADVEGVAALEWLSQNCWEYGFILRYPEGKTDITGILFEPWHFRYVGKEVSMAMKDTGLCLEEYLNAVDN